jgi:F420H(2)-dependent quinone reductase
VKRFGPSSNSRTTNRARSGGRFLPQWFGAPVMVLETVGRRSGRKRSSPVVYLRDAGALVVLNANAGAQRTPAWWLNLKEAGEGEVLIGARRMRVRPRLIAGAERDRLWYRFVEMYPPAAQYARFAEREFSLIALEPIER